MLGPRIATAIALLLLLGLVLGSGSQLAFVLTLAVFFGAACWESLKLFKVRYPLPLAAVCAMILLLILNNRTNVNPVTLSALCVLIWTLRFVPALKYGLPAVDGARGKLFTLVYMLALLGCFVAIAALFARSAIFMISAMAIVWVADIGAYFVGRAFGKRKLAPHISPGKSWEGAIGGWAAVLLLAGLSSQIPAFASTFAAQLLLHFGWMIWVLLMSLLVAASIVGDLFESLMKRRASVKDSSHLLPGHGGVLDRIDALIPVMPLAVLLGASLGL
jgi:phosphatidate cytidylyltransferase